MYYFLDKLLFDEYESFIYSSPINFLTMFSDTLAISHMILIKTITKAKEKKTIDQSSIPSIKNKMPDTNKIKAIGE